MKPRPAHEASSASSARTTFFLGGKAEQSGVRAGGVSPGAGSAVLNVELVFNQSAVTGAYATSPMRLLTPRSRGTSVLTYASNFGGGLVAGDQTRLDLHIGRGARCFVGTQASTKVYRNPSSLPCGHITRADLGPQSLLVLTPAPVQPFAESSYEQSQQFHLAPGAGLVLLDWFTAGRTARGERWAFSRFATRNQVWHHQCDSGPTSDGVGARRSSNPSPSERCIFLDSLVLDASEGPLGSKYRTGRFNCFATLLLVGALVRQTALELLREVGSLAVPRRGSWLVSASPTRDGAVLRMASEELSPIEQFLNRYLTPIAALLGDDPWSRRW